MKVLKTIAVISGLAITAGCGAGGVGQGISIAPIGSGPITNSEVQSWAKYAPQFSNLTEDSITIATPGDATATYGGLILWEEGIGDQVIMGRMTLDANFTGGTISGQTGDFSVANASVPTGDEIPTITTVEVLSGTLPITNGSITGTSMSADMNGTLGSNDGNYSIAGQLTGTFLDVAGQSIVGGDTEGTMTHPNTTVNSMDGAFLAYER